MQTQWYLCEINKYPQDEGARLKKTDNLSVEYPTTFINDVDISFPVDSPLVEDNKKGEGNWYVWLPIIPRVGDNLQFAGWQVTVSNIILETDFRSETGIKNGRFVSARISIRDNSVTDFMDNHFSVGASNSSASHKWEDFARRGHDLQYFSWELRHESYVVKTSSTESIHLYRWHTRIRPFVGDVIMVENRRWSITSVELASADALVDGWLSIEAVT